MLKDINFRELSHMKDDVVTDIHTIYEKQQRNKTETRALQRNKKNI